MLLLRKKALRPNGDDASDSSNRDADDDPEFIVGGEVVESDEDADEDIEEVTESEIADVMEVNISKDEDDVNDTEDDDDNSSISDDDEEEVGPHDPSSTPPPRQRYKTTFFHAASSASSSAWTATAGGSSKKQTRPKVEEKIEKEAVPVTEQTRVTAAPGVMRVEHHVTKCTKVVYNNNCCSDMARANADTESDSSSDTDDMYGPQDNNMWRRR